MSSISASDEAVLMEIEEQTGLSYDPDSDSVEFSSHPNDTEQYVSLVEYLVGEGYITKDDIPISAAHARTRSLINSTGEHENKEFARPRKVGDGVYLETNHDSYTKRRYAAMFIKEFVLND